MEKEEIKKIVRKEIKSILDTMILPENRKELTLDNLHWLKRNIGIKNPYHLALPTAIHLIKSLLTEEEKNKNMEKQKKELREAMIKVLEAGFRISNSKRGYISKNDISKTQSDYKEWYHQKSFCNDTDLFDNPEDLLDSFFREDEDEKN